MESFTTIIKNFKPSAIVAEFSILDIGRTLGYASGSVFALDVFP